MTEAGKLLDALNYAAERWLKVNANNYSEKLVASLQQELRLAAEHAEAAPALLENGDVLEAIQKWLPMVATKYIGLQALSQFTDALNKKLAASEHSEPAPGLREAAEYAAQALERVQEWVDTSEYGKYFTVSYQGNLQRLRAALTAPVPKP